MGEFWQLEIWAWKSYVRLPILQNSKEAETPRRIFMEYMMNIGANKYRSGPPGGHNPPGRAREPRRALVGCAHPGPPPVPIFCYISHFDLEKIRRGLLGWSAAVSRRNLGRSTLPSGGVIPPGEFPSRRGKPSSSSSPITLPSWGGLSSSTSSQHQLLSTPSSSLVFNLVTGTIDWYLWVTSSVDYIL